jgi:prepilin-type N-terminal cleavage/methylation domain-containing protein
VSTLQSRTVRQARNGFTLLELIVVVVLLGIIALLAGPTFTAVRGVFQWSSLESSAETFDRAYKNELKFDPTQQPSVIVTKALEVPSTAQMSVSYVAVAGGFEVSTGDKRVCVRLAATESDPIDSRMVRGSCASAGGVLPGGGGGGPSVPCPPVSVVGAPAGTSVRVAWLPSCDGGTPILDYDIKYSSSPAFNPESDGTPFVDGLSTTPSAQVTSLPTGASYQFSVRAVNANGPSAWSIASPAVAVNGTPSIVSGLTATSGNTQVALSWTAATTTGSTPVSDYIVEYSTDGMSYTTFADGVSTATSTTVASLINLTNYSFRVSARNTVGTGPASTAVQATPRSPMVLTIDTTRSAGTTFSLPLLGAVDARIDWGSPAANSACPTSVVGAAVAAPTSCTYPTAGTYTITVQGTFARFGGSTDTVSQAKMTSVTSFGQTNTSSLEGAFVSASNLTSVPTSLPSTVTSLRATFEAASTFNSSNVTTWNTVNVTDMSYMFFNAFAFNQPIGSWNTANVTTLEGTFAQNRVFNQPIGSWNTANVTNMYGLFFDAQAFNQPLGSWNTANVTTMEFLFWQAYAFNQPIGTWDTSNVTSMTGTFGYTRQFNQPIEAWDTSNVTTMQGMFQAARAFNQPIGSWNTSNVTDMANMFLYQRVFNQPIGTWDTSKVTNMSNMFLDARVFNQPLGAWNTSKVANMESMFNSALAFNQDLRTWCVTLLPTAPVSFSQNSPLSATFLPVWGTCV